MAIADKLQAVLNSKNDIKEALTEKDQSPTDVFSTYANLIRNIETSVDGESITEELNEQTATADELVAIAKRKYFETLNAGIYVWKKLTAEDGDFIEYVVSGEETTYPDGGEQDGYWYEMVKEGSEYGILFDDTLTSVKIVMPNIGSNVLSSAKEFFGAITSAEIITDTIGAYAFKYAFNDAPKCKLKIKTTSIGQGAFQGIGSGSKVWISKECANMYGSSTSSYCVFASCTGLTIYCEASSIPSGWDTNWNSTGRTVTWGVTEEAFDAL